PQLGHNRAVRQEDQMHMPGLALAVPELTLAHAEMLLPVPMKGLRSCPAMAIGLEDASDFPEGSVRHQHLVRLSRFLVAPEQDQPHGMLHLGDLHRLGEPILSLAIDGDAMTGL